MKAPSGASARAMTASMRGSGRLFQPRRWLPLGVLLAGFTLFFIVGGQRYASFEMLRSYRGLLMQLVAAHAWLAPLVYMLAYAAMAACSLPGGAVATLLGGFLFGPVLGTLYVVLGATLGATLLFLVARTTIGAVLSARAGPVLHKMEAGFRENALSYLLVLRLIPLFPFWLVNLVPALLNVPLGTYVLATFFGIIPATFAFALAGSSVAGVLDSGQQPALDILFRGEVLAALIGLALLSLAPVAYKAWKARGR